MFLDYSVKHSTFTCVHMLKTATDKEKYLNCSERQLFWK